jgi:hypothetical protein
MDPIDCWRIKVIFAIIAVGLKQLHRTAVINLGDALQKLPLRH